MRRRPSRKATNLKPSQTSKLRLDFLQESVAPEGLYFAPNVHPRLIDVSKTGKPASDIKP